MNILITICGRAGSKGLKNKNLKKFHDHPLLCYTLSTVDLLIQELKEDHIDVILNTDSSELQELASSYFPLKMATRKEDLSGDTVSKIAVIKDTYIQAEELFNCEYDIVIDLDITSPIRTVQDILNIVEKKRSYPDSDVIFSVVESRRNPYFNMVKQEKDYVNLVIPSKYVTRQSSPAVFDMNASIYLYDPRFLLEEKHIFDGKCLCVEMEDYLVLDIDSEKDFVWMEYIYIKLLEEFKEIKRVYENITNLKM